MARILRFERDRFEDNTLIKSISVEKVIKKLGIEITGRRKSAGLIGLCPLHSELNPSWAIQDDRSSDKYGLFNCYHGSSGDLIDLVAQVKDISRTEAKNLLYKWCNLDALPIPDSKDLLHELNTIPDHQPEPIQRIPLPRTKDDPEMIINYLRTNKSRRKSNYTREDCLKIVGRWQLRVSAGGWYKDRIIIPFYDEHGDQIMYQAQALDPEAIKGLKDPLNKKKLFPSGSKPNLILHGLHHLIEKGITDAVIVEGFFDAAFLDLHGIPTAVAGQARLSNEQISLIIEHLRRVWVFFDNDKKNPQNPGQSGAKAACKKLARFGVEVYRVVGPPNIDPDELGSREKVRKVIKKGSIRYVYKTNPTYDDIESALNDW